MEPTKNTTALQGTVSGRNMEIWILTVIIQSILEVIRLLVPGDQTRRIQISLSASHAFVDPEIQIMGNRHHVDYQKFAAP